MPHETNPHLLLEGLSDAQRARLLTFGQEPRQMGIGMMEFLPGMVEQDGMNHPCFGPHYRLTPLGVAVKALITGRGTIVTGWTKNAAGVKDGAACYRTINGLRWSWFAEDIALFRAAGVRCRKTPDGQGCFVHPHDDEKATFAVNGE